MNDNNVSSNFNNLNFRINITKLLQENFQSISTQAYRRNYIFGDDEKNHQKLKPLIIYDDIIDIERQQTISSSSSSSFVKKMNLKFTQSTEADNPIENPISFYPIMNKFYDQYNNQPFQTQISENTQKPVKKIQRLYTEYNEQFQSQQKKNKGLIKSKTQALGTKKLNSSCRQKNKQLL